MLFGRAQEEIAALEAAGIAYEIVPGVTAALAASAELGISLTQRGVARTVTFVTPRVGAGEDANNWVASVLGRGRRGDLHGRRPGAGDHRRAACCRECRRDCRSRSSKMLRWRDARAQFTTLARLPEIEAQSFTGPTLILLGPQYRPTGVAAIDAERCRTLFQAVAG